MGKQLYIIYTKYLHVPTPRYVSFIKALLSQLEFKFRFYVKKIVPYKVEYISHAFLFQPINFISQIHPNQSEKINEKIIVNIETRP